jgi:predicted phage-related endonuclease
MTTATTELAIDRRQFLGGSDISAALGISPWQTPYQLYCEKTSETPLEIDPKRQAIFDRGKRLEPFIVEWARQDLDLHIVQKNARYTDPVLRFLSCEVDFEHEFSGSIENADAKSVHPSKSKEWGLPGTDEIPDHYTAQFLFGQMVTGRDSTLCMAMFGIDKLEPYRVRRNEEVIVWMRVQAEIFWERVQKRTPPEITTLEDAKIAWRREHPAKQVVATSEITEIAERLKLMRLALKGEEAKADLLELDLKKYIADAEELVDSQGCKIASWKVQQRKSYTVAASESRVLRLAGRD